MRLFALDALCPQPGVPGAARAVAPGDDAGIDLLAAWRAAFDVELDGTWPHPHTPREDVVRALAGGAGELLWEVDGTPVAQAAARAVTAGMSRIGPVYTPPEHRRCGYAAAVTAAATRWALDRGARHVLLYTDLANATTNRLYPRLGFRPRYDARSGHVQTYEWFLGQGWAERTEPLRDPVWGASWDFDAEAELAARLR